MYSSRSLDRAALTAATLLLAACQAEPAAENAPAREIAVPGPLANTGNAAAADVIPPPAPAMARYRFTGTEPFWGGTIEGGTILYQTPEDQAGKTVAATIAKAGAATLFSGTLDGRPFVLALAPGTCSDGMSDTVYPLTAELTVNGEQRQGCANPIAGDATR